MVVGNQVNVIKNLQKPSLIKRTNSSISMIPQLENDKTKKRISFQEGGNQHITNTDKDKQNLEEASNSDFKENKMHRISEERKDDIIDSSMKVEEPIIEMVNDKAPTTRKKAFLVSQLGIDNPTFHDENSSYVLDTLTLTTNRLNSSDCSAKL